MSTDVGSFIDLLFRDIPPSERKAKSSAILTDILGGPDVLNALLRHHGEGESVRSCAAWMRLTPSTLVRQMERAEKKLRQLGMFPARWERPVKSPAR